MDEPIRFADILFTLLTLVITGLILYAVSRGRNQDKTAEDSPTQESESQTTEE